MSETSIIPTELRKLLLWHVSHHEARAALIEKVMAATFNPQEVTEVAPLDLDDLRKTQRRVAALLGQPTKLEDGKKTKQTGLPTICSVCSRLNPHRFSERNDNRRHTDRRCNQKADIRRVTFRSPGLRYSQGGLYGSGGLLDDLLGLHDDGYMNDFVLPPICQHKNAWVDTTDEGSDKDGDRERLVLPPIGRDSRASMVSNDVRDYDGTNRRSVQSARDGDDGDDLEIDLMSRLDPGLLQRTHTLESERTGGSLRIDEDYVPMSVTVRKVTYMDLDKSGASPYQEFSEFFSDTSDPPSRERHKRYPSDLSTPEAKLLRRLYSPDRHQNENLGLAGTKEGHPDFYSSRGGSDSWAEARRGSRDVSAADLLVTRQLTGHRSPTSSTGNNLYDTFKRDRSSTRDSLVSKSETNDVLRVRFAESTKQQQLQLSHDEGSHIHTIDPCDPKSIDNVALTKKRKGQSKVKGQRDNLVATKIDPDIHKKAYLLAVKDAHCLPEGQRKQKQKKKRGKHLGASTHPQHGTIFSYFPLLKRPANGEVLALGVRQDPGSKVKLKDAMKHVLGKIKLGDYYPGGRMYRPS